MSARPQHPLRATVLAVCAGVLTLAGCGDSGGEEPTGLGESTTTAPSAEPSADPTETPSDDPAGPTEHAFPDAGVTIVTPPPSGPAEQAALAAYVEFAREWRWSLREVRLSEQLPALAVAPVVQTVEDSLAYQEENGIRYGGEMVITPVVEESGDALVVLGGCIDGSAVLLVDDGEERPPDGVDEHPVIPMRVVLGNDGSGWKVNENTLHEDESC
ncbi:hypothetical protein [Jiangella alba]|uniref:Lipoprotein n=1 Tax=Jiangella alba TaxID=561176 RepID=A0A1H5PR35_9ACTN|nr:hypothetical protein [Jiangella alba]SEF16179.1 hypothetical protein SAMN04488561_5267 [Jiangella alba]